MIQRITQLLGSLRTPAPHRALNGAQVLGDVQLRIDNAATLEIDPSVTLRNCTITLRSGASLTLGQGAIIDGATITIDGRGRCTVGKGALLERVGRYAMDIHVADGALTIGAGSRVRASCVVQFDGRLAIGQRTFINEGSEIRCDDSVTIGDYTLISYEACIFDTNTHSTDWRVRRAAITTAAPHQICAEPRPNHAPVVIGNDCWIGQRAALLKGATVGDRAIVALGAVVTGEVPSDHLARGNPATIQRLSGASPAPALRGAA